MATAPTAPPADGPALPPAPSQDDPDNFDSEADASFLAQIPFQAEMQALKANVYGNAQGTYDNALEVANNTATVAANAALAALYAGAPLWVSGTTYGLGVLARSPANGRVYNKITGTAGGVVDPSANSTDWSPVSITTPIQVVAGLVQQAISGGAYAATNTTAQAAATNLLLRSDEADQSPWANSGLTVTANATMGTTGGTTAEKLVESAANVAHYQIQVVTAAANVPYTLSRIVKAAGRTVMMMQLGDDAGSNFCRAMFNLSNGATSAVTNTGTASGASATATHLGSGWYLCTLSGIPATSGSTVRVATGLQGFSAYLGDGVQGIYVEAAQLETGAVSSSRIATGAAQATRGAGIVAPTRFIAPPSPAANAVFEVSVQNGIETNVVDLNGATFYGQSGIVKLDNAYLTYKFQYVNGTWRFI